MRPVMSSLAVVAAALLGMPQALGEVCGKSAGECVRPPSSIDEVACPRWKALYSKIGFCDLNAIAPDQADKCLAVTRTQKNTAVAALTATITMTDPKAMREGLKRSAGYLDAMQTEVNRVADYTNAMIDFSGSRGPQTSPPCFNQNFDRLKSIIDKMDAAIGEAVDKYREAEKALKKLQP